MRRAILRTVACCLILAAVHTPSSAGDNDDIPIADQIIFPFKFFYNVPAYVHVHGTLFADWLAYKQNTYSISCNKSGCLVANINQTGPKMVDEITGPIFYPILKWSDDEIIVQDDSPCVRETITIDRVAQSVLWTWIPINQSTNGCIDLKKLSPSSATPRTATIENPMFWKLH